MRGWRTALVLAVVAVAATLVVKSYSGYTLDDSYITYRYAENISSGNGFVYNEGERELGTTTPLYTLLLALLNLFGISVQVTALWVGALAFAGTVVFTWRLALRFGVNDWLAVLLGLGLCGTPALLTNAVSGMETSLYACLTLGVILLYLDGRMRLFCLTGAALFLVRPDGVLVLATCGIFDLLSRRRGIIDWVRYAGFVVLLSLPWLVFSAVYFGTVLPNSGFSKLLQVQDWGHFSKLVLGELAAFKLLLLLVGLGFVDGWTRDRRSLLPGMFVVVFFGVFTAMSFPACGWYLGAVHAPLFLMAALGAQFLLRSLPGQKTLIWVLLALMGLYQFSTSPERVRGIKRNAAWLEDHHGEVGRWLAENTPEGATVAVDNIGVIGYYSGRRILDVLGLIHRDVVEGIRNTGDKRYALLTHVPEYIAMQNRGASPMYLPSPEWFEEHGYVVEFEARYDAKKAYFVWRRTKPVAVEK